MQALQLNLVEFVLRVDYGVNRILILLLDLGHVLLELFGLLLLKCLEHIGALEHLDEFSSEGALFNWNSTLGFIGLGGVKDEVDDTAVDTLDESRFLTTCLLGDHGRFDAILSCSECIELVRDEAINETASMVKLLSVIQHRSQKIVLEAHIQLIFETVAPV